MVFQNRKIFNPIFFSESFLCGIPPILSILAIYHPSQRLVNVANGIGHNLHVLKRSYRDKRTSAMVKMIFLIVILIFFNYFFLAGLSVFITSSSKPF